MLITREFDKNEPFACDECGKIHKTTYLIQADKNQDPGMGILLCYRCKDKLVAGKLTFQITDP